MRRYIARPDTLATRILGLALLALSVVLALGIDDAEGGTATMGYILLAATALCCALWCFLYDIGTRAHDPRHAKGDRWRRAHTCEPKETRDVQ